ncbi:PAS domain S-box protein [Halorussus halobius]|uniref:PAS domain S-box protein n=1 Tax=Halorussus halobius TaxID=1710537 RepID=UPI001091DEED|nr:PAS domain S-box protein [Halorussus halobius]
MSERAEASESAFWGDPAEGETLQRYRRLVNAVGDGIFQLDAAGRFVGANDALVELTGHSRERLLGQSVSVILDADDRSALERAVDGEGTPADGEGTPADGDRALEVAVRTADGDRIPCELRLSPLVEDGGVRGLAGVVRDAGGQPSGDRGERGSQFERYEAIVEAVDDGVYVVDEDGRFRLVNEAYAELTGYSRERLLGEHVSLVVDEEVRRRAERVEAEMRDGVTETDRIEAELDTASGDRVPVEATFAMLPGSDDARRIGVVRDVTDRRERERALAERKRQLSTLVDNVPGMVYRCRNEPDWPMAFVSDACRDLTGYDPEAFERGDVSWGEDVMVDEDRPAVWEAVQTAVADRETFSVTYRIETADGERRWVRSHGRGVFDEDGDLAAIEGIISDVTERKRLEAELDEIFGRVTDAFYALDDEWRITHANERAEELIDYDGEGLVGRNLWEAFEWATDSTLGEEYRTAMESQESTSFEFYYPDPLDAWYEVHAYPSETGLSVYFRDVTERKERQRDLEESERRYRTLAEHFPNGAVALVDETLCYRTVGGSPVDEAVPSAAELEGRPVRDVLSPELADELVPRFESALDGETGSFEFESDGGVYRFHVVPVRDDDGTAFAALAMSQDVTERIESERRLAESERRYRTLAESFPNGIVTLFDRESEYALAAGKGFDRIPLEPADLEGRHFRAAWDEDTADALEPAFRAALDGEERSVELSYAGREWLVHAVPITDENGTVFAGMTMAQDVTEPKERERQLEETVEKLEASNDRLESFASMLAHELRNPVTIGQIYSQQLPAAGSESSDSGATDATADAVEYVTEAFDRMEDIIDVMLVLTRGQEAVGECNAVPVSEVARDAWDEVGAADATLEVDVEDVVQADETYVRHLFRNLLENAVEHGSTSNQPDDAAESEGSGLTVRVGRLEDGFYVADDGSGIPPDEREAVFEAGFTTAGDEGGTGLGLAFVRKLAAVYGWECEVVESDAGGARFEFRNVALEPAE